MINRNSNLMFNNVDTFIFSLYLFNVKPMTNCNATLMFNHVDSLFYCLNLFNEKLMLNLMPL